jgi:hypothetical protein
MFNLCTKLLGTTQMSCQILMNIEIGHLLDQSSGCSGAVNYYVKEGSKVAYGDLVCSVDENGDVSNMINEASQDGSTIDSENLAEIEKTINDFLYVYDGKNYYQVYSFNVSSIKDSCSFVRFPC